jgi:hypothetical protein
VSDRVHTLRASGAFLQSENLSCHGDAETLAKTRAARGHHHASFSQHAIPLSNSTVHIQRPLRFSRLYAFPRKNLMKNSRIATLTHLSAGVIFPFSATASINKLQKKAN